MSDRRVGDRRQPEEGVIKIKFQDAIWYIILVTVIIISVAANIVLAINNNKYKKQINDYLSEDTMEDDYDYDYDYDYEENEVDQTIDEINANTNASAENQTNVVNN